MINEYSRMISVALFRKISLYVLLCTLLCAVSSGHAEAPRFKIGLILPLSGPAADYGQSIENCIQLAREDFPDLFSNIKFIFEDAQHDPSLAISSFRKLTNIDKVDLIYTWGVPFCKVLAPIAEAGKVPLVGQCINQDSSAGRKYVVRFMNYTDEYLKTQVEYLRSKRIFKIGVVLAEHPYLEEMYAALRRNLLSGQSVEVVDSYQINDSDLRTSITRLKSSDYDAVGVFLYPGQIAQFYRQAREQQLQLPTFGTNFFESVSELRLARGAMEGAIYANNTVEEGFAERYLKRFHNISQLGFGALGYEFSLLIGRLFNKMDSGSGRASVLDRLTGVARQRGSAAGPFEFRKSTIAGQYFYFPIAVKQVHNDRFVVLQSGDELDNERETG